MSNGISKAVSKCFAGLIALVGVLLPAASQTASADTFTFTLNVRNIDGSTGPFGTVTIEDLVGGGVKITLTAADFNPSGTEGVLGLSYNSAALTGAQMAPGAGFLNYSFSETGWNYSSSPPPFDGFGNFEAIWDRPGSGSTRPGSWAVTITDANTSDSYVPTAADFATAVSSKGFNVAAHIDSTIETSFEGDTFFATSVPAPPSVILLGLGGIGFAGLGLINRFRRKTPLAA